MYGALKASVVGVLAHTCGRERKGEHVFFQKNGDSNLNLKSITEITSAFCALYYLSSHTLLPFFSSAVSLSLSLIPLKKSFHAFTNAITCLKHHIEVDRIGKFD